MFYIWQTLVTAQTASGDSGKKQIAALFKCLKGLYLIKAQILLMNITLTSLF